jgi:pSer/pThr/pTyr-binding forkhead associated (FHA) protein
MLRGERVTVGRAPSNDVVLDHDGTVSSLHAVLECYAGGWTLRDLGSRNGTLVGGTRIVAERALRGGDELRVGGTRIVFRRSAGTPPTERTVTGERAPQLTPRERDVVRALCRPLFGADAFRQPATVREIAAVLVVTEGAVKQHLGNLYDKFGLDPQQRGRLVLANEALRRGAVTPAELI